MPRCIVGQNGRMSSPRNIVVLGSTGSVGTQALDVIEQAPTRFRATALAAGGNNPELLAQQAARHRVSHVGVSDEQRRAEVEHHLDQLWPAGAPRPTIEVGSAASARLATLDCDVVLNAVAGLQGLQATIAGLDAGRAIALANKESLIAGGRLVLDRAEPGQLIPVDSEHSALAQCLRGGSQAEVRKLVLTASGGPFRGRTRDQLRDVTPAQALAHPTWNMGRHITTNSATLVNKGMELIEAELLFGVGYDRIEVVVHPQSVIHSMVEFVDGATLAQASPPDMRLPIALALGWPDRVPDAAAPLDWTKAQDWTFEPVDNEAFPAVELARHAGRAAGCAPAVWTAANEELVDAFHDGRCSFLQLLDGPAAVLTRYLDSGPTPPRDIEDVVAAQDWARAAAGDELAR